MVTLPLDSFHTAHLDLDSGSGMLVCPSAHSDVWLGRESVHGAAWAEATVRLASLGWRPLCDADGLPRHVGRTSDGCLVVEARSMRGTPRADAAGWAALGEAAGLAPAAPHRS